METLPGVFAKLATSRGLQEETATTSLALELDLHPLVERELYEALDWLAARQERVGRIKGTFYFIAPARRS